MGPNVDWHSKFMVDLIGWPPMRLLRRNVEKYTSSFQKIKTENFHLRERVRI